MFPQSIKGEIVSRCEGLTKVTSWRLGGINLSRLDLLLGEDELSLYVFGGGYGHGFLLGEVSVRSLIARESTGLLTGSDLERGKFKQRDSAGGEERMTQSAGEMSDLMW